MTAQYQTSQYAVSASGADTLETPSFAVAGGNRYMIAWTMNGAGSPAQASECKWGGASGQALSSLQAMNVSSFGRFRMWNVVAPNAQTGTGYAHWAATQDELALVMAFYTAVKQAAPVSESGTATGTNTSPTSQRTTAIASDLMVSACFVSQTSPDSPSVNINTAGTPRVSLNAAAISVFQAFQYCERPRAGATTDINYTITSSASRTWGTLSAVLAAGTGQKSQGSLC